MIDIESYKPKPSVFKSFFTEHGISVGTIANYLGMSYPYVCNMLNGIFKMTPKVHRKLMVLVNQLEQEDTKTDKHFA